MSSKEYKSPLCSCISCKKLLSNKGISSHYSISHTIKGKAKNQRAQKRATRLALVKNQKNCNDRIDSYTADPNKCKRCDSPIGYEKRSNTFCSRSCSASYTNESRDKNSYKCSHRDYRKQKKICRISYCVSCSRVVQGKSRKFCSSCLTLRKKELGKVYAKKNNLGGVRPSSKIIYRGEKLGSSYELELAKSLDKHKIKWEIPRRFKYIDPNGKQRSYTPDFYLSEYDVYLDPKNDFLINNANPALGFKDKEKIQIVEKTHNIKVLILNKDELSWEHVVDRIRIERIFSIL